MTTTRLPHVVLLDGIRDQCRDMTAMVRRGSITSTTDGARSGARERAMLPMYSRRLVRSRKADSR